MANDLFVQCLATIFSSVYQFHLLSALLFMLVFLEKVVISCAILYFVVFCNTNFCFTDLSREVMM